MSILFYILRQFSSFCGQLKLYADDGKKYLSDVIKEKGLGKEFVKYMTNRLIDRGVKEPVLWCVVGNKNARHIYDSLGYKEVFCEAFAVKKR